jgi:hypothetical protein
MSEFIPSTEEKRILIHWTPKLIYITFKIPSLPHRNTLRLHYKDQPVNAT